MENPLLVIPTEPENVETASREVDTGAVDAPPMNAPPVDTATVAIPAVDAIWVLSVACPVLISGKKAIEIRSKEVSSCLIYTMVSNK
ncbi:hypothetical protein GCM10027185_09730 [Spirosoma pulveris]